VCEIGVQTGSRGGEGSSGGGMEEPGGAEKKEKERSKVLPTAAKTSLCEIKFTRKDVHAMNKLMCRRMVTALYQVKCDADIEHQKIGKARQGLPYFVPDQFMVLYGMKSIAINKINEFFYGVRAERRRKSALEEEEDEPLLYMFWRACHHGVPHEERLSAHEFDFYLDLLKGVANTVATEHTMNVKGLGAFWNLLGSMSEIQLPVFMLHQALATQYSETHKELCERLKKTTTSAAGKFMKESKGPKAPKPAPSYKFALLGSIDNDTRGFLPLTQFLTLALDGMRKQRTKDAKELQAICDQWLKDGGVDSFELFAAMLKMSHHEIGEDQVMSLFHQASAGDDPDKVDMYLIEPDLRKVGIGTASAGLKYELKRKPGKSSIGDGAADWDDLKAVTKTMGVLSFMTKNKSSEQQPAKDDEGGENKATIAKLQLPGLAAKKKLMLLSLFSQDED